jgi:hypothetical protein
LFEGLPARPVAQPGRAARGLAAVRRLGSRFAAWTGFATCVSWLFAVWASLSILAVVELVLPVGVHLAGAHPGYAADRIGDLAFVNIASLTSSLLSALLVIHGVLALRRGRRELAYRSFERALLVAIFVTQVFSFVESQFGAVFGLAIDLLLLVALRSVRTGERRTGRLDVPVGGGPFARPAAAASPR